ncbi:hypothetical protein W822_14700 [Advenella kashmirensis W13003]|uniref:Uncharacterized protein n=1 Tax=Advenella kashmirensis W13003 TaxID=1424334 RepID=V8QSS1_9BURK|nr:hypothetical protein [Advenella kashmirensis]ETF02388.1 hypothetical protein W822_14700 [Advenella kashmirensis W13003]
MRLDNKQRESITRNMLLGSESYVNEHERISRFLNARYGYISTAFIRCQTPEQGEDLYRILINGKVIVGFDLSMVDGEISEVFEISVADFSREAQPKLIRLNLKVGFYLAREREAPRKNVASEMK